MLFWDRDLDSRELDMQECCETIAIEPLAPPAADRRPTALIVDDDPGCAYLWTRYLGTGWHPLITTRGEEALGLAKSHCPDLILLDINLPGMNGWDVLTCLRADPATHEVPVIICSGAWEPTRWQRLGANGYLLKPVRPEAFRDMVARTVSL
jgi:CheY-like chemotaxis protein